MESNRSLSVSSLNSAEMEPAQKKMKRCEQELEDQQADAGPSCSCNLIEISSDEEDTTMKELEDDTVNEVLVAALEEQEKKISAVEQELKLGNRVYILVGENKIVNDQILPVFKRNDLQVKILAFSEGNSMSEILFSTSVGASYFSVWFWRKVNECISPYSRFIVKSEGRRRYCTRKVRSSKDVRLISFVRRYSVNRITRKAL